MSTRMDLHCHSFYSDGTNSPAELVHMAAAANLRLLALTDHDSMDGIPEALHASAQTNVLVLPSIEFDVESDFELHIIGLDVNPDNIELTDALLALRDRRAKRNSVILEKLKRNGYDISPHLKEIRGNVTRLHIAHAIVTAGLASSIAEAFTVYLDKDGPGYYRIQRLTASETILLIQHAGGIPVLAHPCHIRANVHQLIRALSELGLAGIEAYYPSSTRGQTELFVSLAAQHKLLVTCGSDFHGGNRKGVSLGCAWQDVAGLEETAQMLAQRHGR